MEDVTQRNYKFRGEPPRRFVIVLGTKLLIFVSKLLHLKKYTYVSRRTSKTHA